MSVYPRTLPESVAALAGRPEIVRGLISEVEELPHRAVVVARALVGYLNWQEWCCPATPKSVEPGKSPSAATLARAVRVSTRTVRRAYHDLEDAGLLERQGRAWLPNYFRLDLVALLTKAREAREKTADKLRARMERWTPPPTRARAPEREAEPDAAQLLAERDMPEGLEVLLQQLPPELVADVFAALDRADGILQHQGAPAWGADYVDQDHARTFPRLMVAFWSLLHPEAADPELLKRSGQYRRRIAAAWRSTSYCPVERMLVDLALLVCAKGRHWHKSLRGDRWVDVLEGAWTSLRERAEEAEFWGSLGEQAPPVPDPLPDTGAKGPSGPQVDAEAVGRVKSQAAIIEALSAALLAAPALPKVAQLAVIDPERRRVGRIRVARGELRATLERWHQLAQGTPPPLDELSEALEQARVLAAELGLSPND